MPFSVHAIEGLSYKGYSRGVVFLRCTDSLDINAEKAFGALADNDKNRMRDKFEYWMRGNNQPSEWFHGFDDEPRKQCYVFKRKRGYIRYRYYGFLMHPQPQTDPTYWLCVLATHAQKNTEETDPAETNFINVLRVRPEVILAVRRSFPDS